MVWTPERASVNQKTQWGAESTSALGTPVAANKYLGCFNVQFGIEADVNFFTAGGRKYPSTAIENTEWISGSFDGTLDYNGVIYPLASIMGAVNPAAHGASSTAKDWIYTPPLTSPSVVPQTFTIEQGDSTRAHKAAYCLVTEWGYKGTRKDFTTSGKLMAQPISDGITMTSNPTAVALAPVAAKQVNVYLDATSGGLGTTLLTRVLSIEYQMTNVYGPLWVFNRSTAGWTAHVDLKPQCTVKLKVEADANGMAMLGYLQAGTTYYLRTEALGATIDTPNAVKNTFQHDMALKFDKPSTFADDSGVFAIEWNAQVVEDPSWGGSGKAQIFTVTNLITGL
ncbi:MAG TPA: hypothetical protein VHL10_00810 [Nitrososphaera sp.]|jgi:hypothetical protein|nr:hypothetical protein [Nitrososphaera sp.]